MKSRPSKVETTNVQNSDKRRFIAIDGTRLTTAEIAAIARDNMPVQLTPEGRGKAAAAHQTVLKVSKKRPIYGQSTGVGSNKEFSVDDSAYDHGMRLLESHAAGAGLDVTPELALAMMAVRLNQLAAGGSGVNPSLLDALTEALNAGLRPPLKRIGAIGTGDLTVLATLALCIAGKRPWIGGSMEPQPIDRTDALAFMSSNAATLGEAALATVDITHRLHAGLSVAAYSFIALHGSPEAYAAPVHAARPHPGQIQAAEELRRLLGKDLLRPAKHVQDKFGLRALPQVQGAALDAAERLKRVIEIDINSPSENPLVSTVDAEVFHNGNFHSVYIGQALDALRSALYEAASLSISRLSSLMAASDTGQRPFLSSGPTGDSGLLIIEYIAHSALSELRHLAQPDGLSNAVLSHGAEEHASFATQSAWHTTDSVPHYETILACELLTAATALRQQQVRPSGTGLSGLFDATMQELEAERPIEGRLARLTEYIRGI